MKKLTSYIWPTTQQITSKINGILDITWINGKKVLDSKNANYSYGSLQRLLEYGFSKIYFDQQSDILVLGMGGGSVLHSLRKRFNHKGAITAVEIDPVIVDIAINEFQIKTLDDIEIICTNGLQYIKESPATYDLIILDIFMDRTVPEELFYEENWERLHKCLNNKGTVLFNAGILVKDDSAIRKLQKQCKPHFDFERYDRVQGTNLLLIARKK